MAIMDYVEYEDSSEELREIYDQIKGTRPAVYNIYKMMGNSPQLLKNSRFLSRYLREESVLERKLRELAILTVADVTGTRYIWAHHAPLARTAGATREEIEAVRIGNFDSFDRNYRIALRYATGVAGGIPVKHDTFAELKRCFDPQSIVELTYLVGYYLMTSTFLTALQVDLEPEYEGEG